jgi:uroporphyrinogen-III decarboxylase
LPYFKKLPRGSTVIEMDSTTDIFLSKEVLRGHLCIHGDVSASLLSIGKPEEVEDYCRRLIDEVGGDGGFILGSGCGVPPDIKPENFRAMIETGKNYELSKK